MSAQRTRPPGARRGGAEPARLGTGRGQALSGGGPVEHEVELVGERRRRPRGLRALRPPESRAVVSTDSPHARDRLLDLHARTRARRRARSEAGPTSRVQRRARRRAGGCAETRVCRDAAEQVQRCDGTGALMRWNGCADATVRGITCAARLVSNSELGWRPRCYLGDGQGLPQVLHRLQDDDGAAVDRGILRRARHWRVTTGGGRAQQRGGQGLSKSSRSSRNALRTVFIPRSAKSPRAWVGCEAHHVRVRRADHVVPLALLVAWDEDPNGRVQHVGRDRVRSVLVRRVLQNLRKRIITRKLELRAVAGVHARSAVRAAGLAPRRTARACGQHTP